jgi:hypothetical protein
MSGGIGEKPIMLGLLLAAAASTVQASDDRATYVLGTLPHCVRVKSTDTGVDGRRWAWIVGGNVPQWVLHVPVNDLGPGCIRETAEAKR